MGTLGLQGDGISFDSRKGNMMGTHHLTVPVLLTAAAMTLEKRSAEREGGFQKVSMR